MSIFQYKCLATTFGILAKIPLFPLFGFAVFDNIICATSGTFNGFECHALPCMQMISFDIYYTITQLDRGKQHFYNTTKGYLLIWSRVGLKCLSPRIAEICRSDLVFSVTIVLILRGISDDKTAGLLYLSVFVTKTPETTLHNVFLIHEEPNTSGKPRRYTTVADGE